MAQVHTTKTTVDTFIQEVWSKNTRDTYEKNLVWGALFDHTFEEEFAGTPTDLIRVQGHDNFGAADAYTAGDDPLTMDAGVYLTQLTIAPTRHYYKSFTLDRDAELFSNMDQMQKLSDKAAYAVSLEMDTFLAGLPDNFAQTVGTLAIALDDDDIIRADQYLNDAFVPRESRYFVYSAAQDAEFKKVERYTNMQYASAVGQINTAHGRGYVGSVHGLDWYYSDNTEGSNAAGHDNAIFQKEAAAVVVKDSMRMEGPFFELESDSTQVAIHNVYGASEIRDTSGVWAKGL